MTKERTIQVRIPKDLQDALVAEADALGIGFSEYIRKLLAERKKPE